MNTFGGTFLWKVFSSLPERITAELLHCERLLFLFHDPFKYNLISLYNLHLNSIPGIIFLLNTITLRRPLFSICHDMQSSLFTVINMYLSFITNKYPRLSLQYVVRLVCYQRMSEHEMGWTDPSYRLFGRVHVHEVGWLVSG